MSSYNAIINFAYCFISLFEIIINVNNQVVIEELQESFDANERLKTEQTTE